MKKIFAFCIVLFVMFGFSACVSSEYYSPITTENNNHVSTVQNPVLGDYNETYDNINSSAVEFGLLNGYLSMQAT